MSVIMGIYVVYSFIVYSLKVFVRLKIKYAFGQNSQLFWQINFKLYNFKLSNCFQETKICYFRAFGIKKYFKTQKKIERKKNNIGRYCTY